MPISENGDFASLKCLKKNQAVLARLRHSHLLQQSWSEPSSRNSHPCEELPACSGNKSLQLFFLQGVLFLEVMNPPSQRSDYLPIIPFANKYISKSISHLIQTLLGQYRRYAGYLTHNLKQVVK